MLTLPDFEGFISSLNIQDLKSCQQIIDKAIVNKLPHGSGSALGNFECTNNTSSNPSQPAISTPTRDINDFVKYYPNFIDNLEHDLLSAELESLNFNFKTKSDAVQNVFISSYTDPYT